MRNLVSQLLAVGPELAAYILTAPLLGIGGVDAQFTQTALSSPHLDLGSLGRVAVGGDFDSISIQTYEGQNQNLSSNGSQSLLARYPNGAFQSLGLVDADASIAAMCPFIGRDGNDRGIVVGGNFTSLAGVQASSIALWNPNTAAVTPLSGLTGPVRALYCDADSTTVYVGGNFMAGSSNNAMAWTTQWQNLPFAGFNGPVNSITKNSAGNLVFGGSFDGLGNASTPTTPDAQVVNLGSGNITSSGAPDSADPRSIICSTAESGNAWTLNDNVQGWWQGSYGFGFIPTKLRLYNVQGGRGTRNFYFENMDDGGILNLTYTDPSTGQKAYCDRVCPLPENNSTAQDFHFVNPVGLSVFRIWLTGFYGSGAGLAGIELFQNDIYSYAVSTFNEPQCDGISNASSSTASPNSTWVRKPNLGQTSSDYLLAALDTSTQISSDTNVVFRPNLAQSGNYSVLVYTPGCVVDNTCSTRGQVNITASLTSTNQPTTTTLFQTNNYEKFDQIYYGYIDVGSGDFRPSVTLSPATGQSVPLTVVASRVRFELINSTGGLNGLYEYNPNQPNSNSQDFSTSAINRAGASLNTDALINDLAEYDETTYVAGNFKRDGISNVMAITDNATALSGGGLNGEVMDMYLNGSTLYMAGVFSNTADNTITGLNNIAAYSIPDRRWSAFGAGVDGAVFDVVPLRLNISANDLQDCFALTGNFSNVNAFSGNSAFTVSGFAVWVPSRNNWLHNLADATAALNGRLTAYTEVPKMSSPLYGGMISSQGLDFSDVVELMAGSGQPTLQSLGTELQQSSGSNGTSSRKRKRAIPTQDSSGHNYTGVYDGIFYQNNNLNITVLGGNFEATASNGSQIRNLAFINNTGSTQSVNGVNGLDEDSIFVAVDFTGTLLFAGGAVNGTVNGANAQGLVVYDLSLNQYYSPHPAALGGDDVSVNAIAAQPETNTVFIGGTFETAGSLPCRTLCTYDVGTRQYLSVGDGLSGTINSMIWASNTNLVIAGNLSINGNPTMMATYNTKKQTFTPYTGASSLPGPISAITAVNTQYTEFWVSGVATSNNSVYLSKYADGTWTGAGGLGRASIIRKLQIMPLSSSGNHADSALMASDQMLMIMGNINIPNEGNASAVLFNGTTFEPFMLTNMDDGSEGSISAIFVSNPSNFINERNHHLSLGAIVGIALAIAAGLIFLMVVAGILLERRRKRKEGYVPISADKSSNIARLPPETLFHNLEGRPSPPRV
ncbi:related to Pst1p [Lecanosticta acicola]|uniref:Related to Pst1p n=1 Tax=Lecanosticta acicola TaxID=111012 RepID=A0AAI8Z1Q0_9PEZI|nr:related to Pst1p [Lecanosticta acicola]